ncbi:hypothetical protein GCM10007913_16720 [Devosia yakushimensis]|uniref:Uncharacterized protein n=1 Tax=Devosia yakushimensis TaxID=470028 RepID=A0ABQ5UDC9_9HYPH|nr:hypothetical protein GCM10007913_16720 [Devosia yakushimensis]
MLRLEYEAQLATTAGHFHLQDRARLDRNRQYQIQQVIADLYLRAAIGRRADDLGGNDLSGLEGQSLERATTCGNGRRRKLRGNRHGPPAPPPPHAA